MPKSRTGTRERASEILEVVEGLRQGHGREAEQGLALFLVTSSRLRELGCPTECKGRIC